jgi:hypothetical protein
MLGSVLRRGVPLVVLALVAGGLSDPSRASDGHRKPAIKMTEVTSEGGEAVDFEAGVRHATSVFVRLRDESEDTVKIPLQRDGKTEYWGPRWAASTSPGGDPCRAVAFIARNQHGRDAQRYGRMCLFRSGSAKAETRSFVWTADSAR